MSSRTHMVVGGRVVAITGAARGIGRATARALVAKGARVSIGDVDVALARRTAEELGAGVVALPLDVTDRASVDEFVAQTEERLGPIDVFINNAGIMPTTWFLEEDEASIQRQFAINVLGPINGMRAVIPRMLERGRWCDARWPRGSEVGEINPGLFRFGERRSKAEMHHKGINIFVAIQLGGAK